jgi:hypothetical protein
LVVGASAIAILVAAGTGQAWASTSPPGRFRQPLRHVPIPAQSLLRHLAPLGNVRTPDRISYTLDLTSDAEGFTWTGTESVTFTNVAAGSLSRVWIRLWDNGFEGCTDPLAIQVTNVSGGTAGSLQVDCSALPVDLPVPLHQGEEATVSFDLTILVPDANWRFGRIGTMALLGNAVPLLAIRDAAGWHLDPYTSLGESFYSQDGDFDVTFHTPDGLRIAATGQASSRHATDGEVTTTYVATGVRDFAWASGPLRELDGTAETGVLIRVWAPEGFTSGQAQAALDISEQAMAFHATRYGPYLYPEVDVVLGNFTSFGGMEYPQLVMTQEVDSTIVHELGHQWWYGIVGDDQWTEPWLDEAFATYATDIFYGDTGTGCDHLPWPSETARISNNMGYWDTHAGEYFYVVYEIGSCALHDLSGVLGDKLMARFLFSYAGRNALGFSTTIGFQASAQAAADRLPEPVDLTQFWIDHRIGEP